MTHRFLATLYVFFLSATLSGQSVTSVSGTVTDPSGAVIPRAAILIQNVETALQREATADDAGRYLIPQLPPGTYKISAKAQGFSDVVVADIHLMVNVPTTVNITFTKVGTVTETVSVVAEAAQVNTTDASIGNAFGARPILQLPMEARNVVGLLALQPGVTFTGEGDASSRNGSVNGGKSDQANVTLDGVDVNDQQNRSAFTSVLRVTLDSVQEFRVTTTNANADMGRSSGAQVALITRNGSNEIHGSAYEFHRNTVTTANSFFNNAAKPSVTRPKLIRNTFGASVGGPVKKNRLFYFFNYEGRRDAKESSIERIVPTADFRNGYVSYQRQNGSTGVLTPAEVKLKDPLGIGANPTVLKVLQAYPTPNSSSSGDGYNTAGFRFVAPRPLRWNTYIGRFDWNPSDSGKHNFFLRGNLQNDRDISAPQFPGQVPSAVNLNNSKGLAAGYNTVFKPTLTAAFRYGFTRQGVESTGIQSASAVSFLSIDDPSALTTGAVRILPVHTFSGDFNYMRGAHAVQFGATMRLITNDRNNYDYAFNSAQTRASVLKGAGAGLDPADINSRGTSPYRTQMVNLLGVISTGTANYNYDLQGNLLPSGAPVARKFRSEEYELYAQDTFRVSRGLTITAGLRWSLAPPIHEANGVQVGPAVPLGAWFDQRGAMAQQGKSVSTVAPIKYIPIDSPGGMPLYEFHKKNFGPRFSVAYAPQAASGWLHRLFGDPGQTSIRAGWGMFYDSLGNSLILRSDSGSFGLSSSITSPNSQFTEATGPRYTGIYDIPAAVITPAPKFTFPVEAPYNFAKGSNVDSQIKPGYTMNMNFSIGREFSNGLFVQASYVGRMARKSAVQTDTATPTNLVDPTSGMDYYTAATILARLINAKTPVADVQKLPYFENMWPAAAGSGLTATQGVYKKLNQYAPDYTYALEDLDRNCVPGCSKLGPYAVYDRQFASLTTWRSIAGGNYHAMQWTMRQRFTQGLEFGFNYTLSKSIDLSSRAERDGTGATFGFITNPWNPGLHKAVSDYDMTHQWNANFVAELPFGKGKRFLNSSGVLDAIFGGWQISGIYRQTTGLPISVSNGRYWPTNWQWQGFATPVSTVVGVETSKNATAPNGSSGPNMFLDPAQALKAFDFTLPGGIGGRNVIRGDGYFTIDSGVSKRFRMPYSEKHSLQIRWETFNLTNSVRFDVSSLSVNIGSSGTFGKYSDVLTQPRVMQFGARYEF